MNTREIKFRAWDKDRKEWIKDFGISRFGELALFKGSDRNFHSVEIMQFTGLRDKNGVEIYEGDLVVFGNWESGKWKIGWNGDLARFDLFWVGGGEEGWLTLCDEEEDAIPLDLKIVGNIYENPELLKQEERSK